MMPANAWNRAGRGLPLSMNDLWAVRAGRSSPFFTRALLNDIFRSQRLSVVASMARLADHGSSRIHRCRCGLSAVTARWSRSASGPLLHDSHVSRICSSPRNRFWVLAEYVFRSGAAAMSALGMTCSLVRVAPVVLQYAQAAGGSRALTLASFPVRMIVRLLLCYGNGQLPHQ